MSVGQHTHPKNRLMIEGALVHVVDDDPAVRKSFVYLLESAELRVESYSSAEEFLAKYQPNGPGCLILDLRLPGMDGLALQREVADRGWRLPVVVVTSNGSIATAVEAMRRGAYDFIEKPFDETALVECVLGAVEHDRGRRRRDRERESLVRRIGTLSPRETEVMELVVAGEATKAIASELGTSFNTVQNQRASILRKMQARSVADLVRMVMIARSPEGN